MSEDSNHSFFLSGSLFTFSREISETSTFEKFSLISSSSFLSSKTFFLSEVLFSSYL